MTPAPVIPVIVPATGGGGRGPRFWILTSLAGVGVLLLLTGGALLGVREWWPAAQVEQGSTALAEISLAPAGEHIASVKVRDSHGRLLAVRVRSGQVVPAGHVAGGSRLTVAVTVRRSGWAGWLVGSEKVVHTVIRTPAAIVGSKFVYPDEGKPVTVRFSRPVQVVSIQTGDGAVKHVTLPSPRRVVPIGVAASGSDVAGTALVAGAPRGWESLPAPVRVTWFPSGATPKVLVRPAPKTTLVPSAPIVLTFSQPVNRVLGGTMPRLAPRVRGTLDAAERPHARLPAERPRLPPRPESAPAAAAIDPADLRLRSLAVPDGHMAGPARVAASDQAASRRPGLPAGQVGSRR